MLGLLSEKNVKLVCWVYVVKMSSEEENTP